MERCPFRTPPRGICYHEGNQHTANRTCQCVRAGFDHLDHIASCGMKWSSGATAAQIDALRVIAANPGIKAMAFLKIRESRGLTYRRLLDLGFIRIEKASNWDGAKAFVTAAGERAVVELLDTRQSAER